MQRRTLLTSVGVGSWWIAGCTANRKSLQSRDLPEDCPVSQNVGVEWQRDLDGSTVASFVERYEAAYYRQHVIDTIFEPESCLFGYSGWIGRIKDVAAVEGGGCRVHFTGIVNAQRGDLVLAATTTARPVTYRSSHWGRSLTSC